MLQTIRKATCLTALFICSIGGYSQMKMTLEDALEYSIDHSPELQEALINLERYKLSLEAQRASLKSKFALTLNPFTYSNNRSFDNRFSEWYTNESFSSNGTFSITQPIIWTDATVSLNNKFGWQNNTSTGMGGANNTNKAFSNDLYLSINQPLFTYNRTKTDLRSIELDYENALINYALRRLSLESTITASFYNVYTAKNNLEISEAELKDAQQNFDIIKNKVDADLSARDELYQAELNLSTAASAVDNRRVSLENAKDDLKQLLGITIDEDIDITAEISAQPVKIDMLTAIHSALGSRLELRQREISRTELDIQMKQIKEMNSLDGNISLSLGIMGDHERLQNIYEHPTNNPRVAVTLSVPIFDWGERRARIKAQELATKIFDLQTEEERKSIEIAVRKSCRSLRNLEAQIAIAEQSVKNAQLTYDLNAERYRNGELTGMEMNQFQTQLSNQKMSYMSTLINYKLELLNLKIISLYDFEADKPIIPMSVIPEE
ncbi:MAG: TolC family protein [Bacteroidaceae bacterium]|nr:TolC family protein [Bacteroidaceae bacterium]MBR6588878.1 TolC family protein [Bacteroidaceae bacterium]